MCLSMKGMIRPWLSVITISRNSNIEVNQFLRFFFAEAWYLALSNTSRYQILSAKFWIFERLATRRGQG
jgi:hypothetical protein